MQPLMISSPAFTSRGSDSPVSAAVLSVEAPDSTVPSIGTFSPGWTTMDRADRHFIRIDLFQLAVPLDIGIVRTDVHQLADVAAALADPHSSGTTRRPDKTA